MTTSLLPRRTHTGRFLLSIVALANIAALWIFAAKHLRLGSTTLDLLGAAGCAAMLYFITTRETHSKWYGLMSIGLFAASHQVSGGYLSVACLLAGCYLIGYSTSRIRDAAGMLLLVAGCSMHPQCSIFLIGGVAYVLWRDINKGISWRQALPSALVALAFGPVLYLVLPTQPSGPTQWTSNIMEEIRIFAEVLAIRFAIPVALAGAGLQWSLERGRPLGIWLFFLPVAFLSAIMGALTTGSNTNELVPFAVWLMLSAILALPSLTRALDRVHFPILALALAFVVFACNSGK